MKAALFEQVSPSTTQQTNLRQRPFQRIPGTNRTLVTLESGTRLERRSIYLSSEAWQAAWRLCNASRISTSILIESMLIEADKVAGNSKEKAHV
jgi:hypothetical protein